MTKDDSLLEVSKALRELLNAAELIEEDSDSDSEEEKTDSECSECEGCHDEDSAEETEHTATI